jgi:hypothetical protein
LPDSLLTMESERQLDDVDEMTLGQKIKNFPRYVKHQIVSLKPPGEMPMNPYTCLRMLNRRQWAFWFLGFLGWTWVFFPLNNNTDALGRI